MPGTTAATAPADAGVAALAAIGEDEATGHAAVRIDQHATVIALLGVAGATPQGQACSESRLEPYLRISSPVGPLVTAPGFRD